MSESLKLGKVVLELLHKKKFDAYYIGGKCRNELHNKFHSDWKVEIKDVDIVTNATPDQIKSIFPSSSIRGECFQVVVVNFGGYEFEVATYRKDVYNNNELKKSKKVVKPKTLIAKNLNEDRERRDFTINAIACDVNDEYVDYTYKYRNKKISAIEDIENKTIRAIGNPRLRFEEDPLRILRAFRFMSVMGYEIEKQTLKAIERYLYLLEKVPHERIGMEFNKLIMGRNVKATLELMCEIGIFDLYVLNSKNKDAKIAHYIKELSSSDFELLESFNNSVNDSNNSDDLLLESWVVLLKSLDDDKVRETLESCRPLSNNDIEKVRWLIKHYNLIDSDDLRNDIFKAKDGIVQKKKMMCMKELLLKMCNIYVILYGKQYKAKAKLLMKTFFSRPYFYEQIKVSGEDFMKIAEREAGPWINDAKDRLLVKLINSEVFPKDINKYMELVVESIQEVLNI